jgi:hypothetical protein
VQVGRHDLDGFEPGGTKVVGDPLGGALDVRLMLAFRADRRNAQKFAQFREMLLAATLNKLCQIHRKALRHKDMLQENTSDCRMLESAGERRGPQAIRRFYFTAGRRASTS